MSLYLLAQVAGQRIALPAGAIESVVEIDAITPIPMVAPQVAGLAALRSRVLTVIDSHSALGLGQRPDAETMQAVVVVIEGHLYGLLVDGVDDVVTAAGDPLPFRGALSAGWSRVAAGMIEHEGEAILLVDPAALIAPPAQRAAA